MSQTTPSQLNRTTAYISSSKRCKIGDDNAFRSQERRYSSSTISFKVTKENNEDEVDQKVLQQPFQSSFQSDETRVLALETELHKLREQRNQLCQELLKSKCKIPNFCIKLDKIGQKFSDNCLFAKIFNQGKFEFEQDLAVSLAFLSFLSLLV